MSFKFETITEEIYLKVDRQILKCKGATFVTPISLPKNFLLDAQTKPCSLPILYKNYDERIKNFEVRNDDTWVVTYPKSGTTWTQELVWLLKNNLDFETAKNISLHSRFPFLEHCAIKKLDGNLDSIEQAADMPSPRFIKSHLPIQLLPDDIWSTRKLKPKIVYVKRNPKDVAVSYFHHFKMLHGYTGTMEEHIDCFVRDYLPYSPFFPHIVDFCEAAEKLDNILVLNYEDMKKDLASVIKTTAKFLDVSISESDVGKLIEHLSFKNMRENKAVNFETLIENCIKQTGIDPGSLNSKFMRKGEIGGWKKELSPEMIEKLDDWIKRNEEANPLIKKYF